MPKHARRVQQQGMTLLEIMIVLGIIALIMGLVIVPKVMEVKGSADRKVARLAVDKYADQDYPRWQLMHTAEACPHELRDIAGGKPQIDPWGIDYKMYCGASAPAPEVTFGAASFGEDRHEHTEDDIRSWE